MFSQTMSGLTGTWMQGWIYQVAKMGDGPHVTQTLKGPESLRLSEMVRCHGVAVAQEGRTLKQGCFAAIGVFVNRGMRGKL